LGSEVRSLGKSGKGSERRSPLV